MNDITADPIFTSILNENKHEKRKHLIKSIEDKVEGKIICYFENPEHPFASINNYDVMVLLKMRLVGFM